MKKMLKHLFCLLMVISQLTPAMAQPQNKKWLVFPNTVALSPTSAPTLTSIPGSSTTGSLYNAMYDDAGNLMFWVIDGQVRDVLGNSFSLATLGHGGIYTHIAIIKAPGYDDRFYIAAVFGRKFGSSHFHYATVDFDCGGIRLIHNSVAVYPTGPYSLGSDACGGIAVSQEVNGTRYLYLATNDHIFKYNVNASGIQYDHKLHSKGTGGCYELDLSHDGTQLAGIDGSQALVIDLNASGNYVSHSLHTITSANWLLGTEFSPAGDKLFLSGLDGSSNGIYSLDLAQGTSALVSGTAGFGLYNLELGHDGRVYGLGQNEMVAVDPVTETATTYSTPGVPGQSTLFADENRFALSNQIDGEVYNYTIQGATTTTSDFTINGLNSSQLQIGCADPILLNGSYATCADDYFLSVRDLTSNAEHMEWLHGQEVTDLLLGTFDLRAFCNSQRLAALQPLWTPSPNMPLVQGRCYEVKLVAISSASPWVPSFKTICIEGSVDPTFSVVGQSEGCIGPAGVLELLANEPGIPDDTQKRIWEVCELDQWGNVLFNTCTAYPSGFFTDVNNPSAAIESWNLERGRCYRITQYVFDEVCDDWLSHSVDVCICCSTRPIDPYFIITSPYDDCVTENDLIELQAFEPGIPDHPSVRLWHTCRLDAFGNTLSNTCVAYSIGQLGNVNAPALNPSQLQLDPGSCYRIIHQLYDEACEDWVSFTRDICICEGPGRMYVDHLAADEAEAQPFTVFPNPARDQLQVQFDTPPEGQVNLTIHDPMGRMVANREQFTGSANTVLQFSTHNLPSGIYLLKVTSGNEVFVQPVIVQH